MTLELQKCRNSERHTARREGSYFKQFQTELAKIRRIANVLSALKADLSLRPSLVDITFDGTALPRGVRLDLGVERNNRTGTFSGPTQRRSIATGCGGACPSRFTGDPLSRRADGQFRQPKRRVGSQSVLVVDEALAQRYFPGQNPLGKGISVQTEEGIRHCVIVGVVPHVRYRSPGNQENSFQAYLPYSEWDFDFEVLILRSEIDPAALTSAVRKVVTSIDPNVPIFNECTYDDLIAQKFTTRRLSVLLVSFFSSAALFLSAIGLYGILAYSVTQRKREIGIRIALGAKSSNILAMVIRQGFKIVAVRLAIGTVTALVLVRFVKSILYGVSDYDAITLATSVLVL
jgi:hypothetical protein